MKPTCLVYINIILAQSELIQTTENHSDMNENLKIDALDMVKLTDAILEEDAIF